MSGCAALTIAGVAWGAAAAGGAFTATGGVDAAGGALCPIPPRLTDDSRDEGAAASDRSQQTRFTSEGITRRDSREAGAAAAGGGGVGLLAGGSAAGGALAGGGEAAGGGLAGDCAAGGAAGVFAGGAGGGLFAGGVATAGGGALSEGVVVCRLEGTATLITPTPAPLPALACPVPLLDPAPAAGFCAAGAAAGLLTQGAVTYTV